MGLSTSRECWKPCTIGSPNPARMLPTQAAVKIPVQTGLRRCVSIAKSNFSGRPLSLGLRATASFRRRASRRTPCALNSRLRYVAFAVRLLSRDGATRVGQRYEREREKQRVPRGTTSPRVSGQRAQSDRPHQGPARPVSGCQREAQTTSANPPAMMPYAPR